MSNIVVPVRWDSRRRVFRPSRQTPALLHTCRESRAEALKTYQLRFASSPEFARVYFSYEHDILLLVWSSLGPAPGRLLRKMAVDECEKLQTLMIGERTLLLHAEDNMRELERFSGLRYICVVCDSDNVESGDEFGAEEMAEIGEELDEGILDENFDVLRTEIWPELVCLRSDDGLPTCSRHWWFDGWNQRAQVKQKKKWPKTLATSLKLTLEDDSDDFFLNMLFTLTATRTP